MKWQPITIEDLQRHISNIEFLLKEDEKSFWSFIKIEPEKWTEKTYAELGGGFWVVAILGKKVLYYNDIEEGFNFSSYHEYGMIDEYHVGQSELHEVISDLFKEIKKGVIRS